LGLVPTRQVQKPVDGVGGVDQQVHGDGQLAAVYVALGLEGLELVEAPRRGGEGEKKGRRGV